MGFYSVVFDSKTWAQPKVILFVDYRITAFLLQDCFPDCL